MKVLITGASGFVGQHLAQYCLSQNCEVVGWLRPGKKSHSSLESNKGSIAFEEFDICDESLVSKNLKKANPDAIFHLAAKSHVGESWNNPAATFTTNVVGQINLLEAVHKLKLSPKIHVAGSAEEYGFVDKKSIPIKENAPIAPISPYAVSKVSQNLMAYQYFKIYNQHIIRTRAFNQNGPGRHESFVTSSFAKQVALMEKGKQEKRIRVGNLNAIRDFTDVRDAVKAYWLVLTQGRAGEVYNICSGVGHEIRSILSILKEFTDCTFEVYEDPQISRPNDIPIMVGDNTKCRKEIGWEPTISFKDSMKDLLNEWRAKV